MSSTHAPTDVLRDYFAKERTSGRRLEDEEELLASGLLDSLAIVKLLAFIEEEFGVEISDDEFDPDNFETIKAIGALILSKKSA